MDSGAANEEDEGQPSWLTHQQFIVFRKSEFAKLGFSSPDLFEDVLTRLAALLGYQAMFGGDTPWILDARIQLKGSSGTVMATGSLIEALEWLRERAPSHAAIRLAEREALEIDSTASQALGSRSASRI